MVTGNKDQSPLIWWSHPERPQQELRGDLCLTVEGNRFHFLLYSGASPLLLGAVNMDHWPAFLEEVAPLVAGNWSLALPSMWYTLIPGALHSDGFPNSVVQSLGGQPHSIREYHSLKQNIHLAYKSDLPEAIQELRTKTTASHFLQLPSEVLDWEFPSLATGRHLVVQLRMDSLQISAFEAEGSLVFSNRFDAPTANDALYALGLVYEHTGWSGLHVPLLWHGSRPDWETIQQNLSAFVLDIRPLSPPKALPELLGDWRPHPSLQSLFRLWLCAS